MAWLLKKNENQMEDKKHNLSLHIMHSVVSKAEMAEEMMHKKKY